MDQDEILKLERYEIEQGADGLLVRVNQKNNALVNLAAGLGMIAFAAYFISTSGSFFFYFLFGLGLLWVYAAVRGYKLVRKYSLLPQRIEYESSERAAPNVLAAGDMSHVSLLRIRRPTGRRRDKPIFPWQVRVVDKRGREFRQAFNFQQEEEARRMAFVLSEYYKLDVRTEER